MRNRDKDVDLFSTTDEKLNPESVSHKAMDIDNYEELYGDEILYALNQLKPQYRRPILYQQAGYKLREIAEFEYMNGSLESRNVETIKSRLFLARQQLKSILTRDGKRRDIEDTEC